MGRPRKKPTYLIVHAEILGSIDKDRVLEFDRDLDEHLLDELECPHIDDVLIALRKAFSLTFPRNPFINGLQEALREIRRIGIDALRTIPQVLDGLHLKPVPTASTEATGTQVYLFQYSVARQADLQIKVKYEGKTRNLAKLLDHRPADGLVRALREAVSCTFAEMHNEEQHEEVLRRIREQIGSVLPAFNDLLVQIEIEPIADWPSLDVTGSAEEESASDQPSTDLNSLGNTPSTGKPSPK